MHDQTEKLAKLEYSLEGEERERYWKEQMQFYAYDENDEDEEEESKEDSKSDKK